MKFYCALFMLILGGCTYNQHIQQTTQTDDQNTYLKGLKAYNDGDFVLAAQAWKELAAKGDDKAQNWLGRLYVMGKGVEQDYSKAMGWLNKSAAHHNPEAQLWIGVMYRKGLGVTQDNAEAVKWYMLAAEQNNIDAINNLGYMYLNGLGVKQDRAEAIAWYTKAAEQGNALAQFQLGLIYARGRGANIDNKKASFWFRKAAEQEDPDAQYNLGLIFVKGLSGEKNITAGTYWLRKAADHGHSDAESLLDMLDGNRLRGTRDEEMPEQIGDNDKEKLYSIQDIQYLLRVPTSNCASIYSSEIDNMNTEQFEKRQHIDVLKNCTDEANTGSVNAMNVLAYLYSTGISGVFDADKAYKWSSESARRGDCVGETLLGTMYLNGTGIDISRSKGLKILLEASRKECKPATQMLDAIALESSKEFLGDQRPLDAQLTGLDVNTTIAKTSVEPFEYILEIWATGIKSDAKSLAPNLKNYSKDFYVFFSKVIHTTNIFDGTLTYKKHWKFYVVRKKDLPSWPSVVLGGKEFYPIEP